MKADTFILFCCIAILIIVFTIGYFKEYANGQPEMIWVGGEKGLRQIPVYYVDTVVCGHKESPHIKGCYKSLEDIIIFKKNYDSDTWAMPGCTIWMHEVLHAWGYDHVEMHKFNCPNPVWTEPKEYDPNGLIQTQPKQQYEYPFKDLEHRTIWN